MFQLHTHYHCIVQCLRVPPPFPLVQLFKLFPPSCGWKKCHILLTPSLSPPLPPKESVLVERVFWAASSLRDCCKSAPLFLALWSSSGSSGARLQLPCLFACSSWRFCNQGTATFTATAMQGKWSHFAALLWLLLGMGGGGGKCACQGTWLSDLYSPRESLHFPGHQKQNAYTTLSSLV